MVIDFIFYFENTRKSQTLSRMKFYTLRNTPRLHTTRKIWSIVESAKYLSAVFRLIIRKWHVVILLSGENTRDASLQEAESSNGADPGKGEGHSVHSSGQDEPAATEDRTAARLRGASRGIHTV